MKKNSILILCTIKTHLNYIKTVGFYITENGHLVNYKEQCFMLLVETTYYRQNRAKHVTAL